MNELFNIADLKYRDFQSGLIPTIDKKRIIGVRTPELRRFAKRFKDKETFMASLPHYYYEENNLHGFLIEGLSDFDECIAELERFLPYIDNWATCDMTKPKVLKKHPDKLYDHIKGWINSEHTYTVRFAINMLMNYFPGNNEYADLVAGVKSEEYYVRMGVAWYFATKLASDRDTILGYYERRVLEPWTHNKAIQKARESYRISKEDKEYLKCLRFSSKS